jgi:hypothetical protein
LLLLSFCLLSVSKEEDDGNFYRLLLWMCYHEESDGIDRKLLPSWFYLAFGGFAAKIVTVAHHRFSFL